MKFFFIQAICQNKFSLKEKFNNNNKKKEGETDTQGHHVMNWYQMRFREYSLKFMKLEILYPSSNNELHIFLSFY